MNPGSEIEYEIPHVVRVHKSGLVERLQGTETVPPSPSRDPARGVASKGVILDPAANISARLYLPAAAATAEPSTKLPMVVFFHGGAFMVHTAASPIYHKYATYLAAAAPVVIVSVDYRLAPEHPVPAAYDNAFAVLKAVVSSCRLDGAEPWLAAHGDASRIILASPVHAVKGRAGGDVHGDVRAVVLDAATGALVGLRQGAVLVDCTTTCQTKLGHGDVAKGGRQVLVQVAT